MSKLIYAVLIKSLIFERRYYSDFIAVMKSRTGGFVLLLSMIFFIALFYLASFSFPYLSKQDSLFNIDARTEYISISPFEEKRYPQWRIDQAKLYDGCDDYSEAISGDLKVNSAATIEIERIETGNMIVTLDTPNFEDTGVIMTDDGQEKTLSDCAILVFDTTRQTYVFPIDGKITLGHQITENRSRPPVLRSGTVYVADRRILADDYYQNNSYPLRIGDRFFVRDPITQASGFVFANTKGELDVSFRVKGAAGVIQKYKTEPIVVVNSFWTKILNDDLLAIFWLFLWTLFGVIKSLLYFKMNQQKKKNQSQPTG